jgi:hypothetical protein
VERGDRLSLIRAGGVEVRHAHAAQADGADVWALVAELASDHAILPLGLEDVISLRKSVFWIKPGIMV